MQGPGKTFSTSVDWEEIDRRLSEDPEALMADLGGSKQAKDNGGPAFPNESHLYTEQRIGMSLRDYFAAKATESDIESHRKLTKDPKDGVPRYQKSREAAKFSYADAMLRERAK